MVNNDSVILLHGMGRTSRSMRKIAIALQAEGYAVVNLSYPSTKKTIHAIVDHCIKPEVRKIRTTADSKIHFVTHSLGGILVRVLLQTETLPSGSRIVMLAPPNKGSEIVDKYKNSGWFKLLNGPAGQALGTESNSLPNQLNAIDYPIGIITGTRSFEPWFASLFQSHNDGKVSVASAKLAEMQDFLEPPLGHTFIMRNRYVINQIKQFLLEARFSHE